MDYPSLYPDGSDDTGSIPPPLPPIINAEADVQATESGAEASLNTSDQGTPGSNAQELQELVDVCRAFLDQIQQGAAPWVVQRLNRLNHVHGPMPNDPAYFSYWMAMVSNFSSCRCSDARAHAPVRSCANSPTDDNPPSPPPFFPTGSSDRRYGKSQTFAGEIAAASSSAGSALDRAVERPLVRRRACMVECARD